MEMKYLNGALKHGKDNAYYSYNEPVAFFHLDTMNWVVSERFYSVTTAKHCNHLAKYFGVKQIKREEFLRLFNEQKQTLKSF